MEFKSHDWFKDAIFYEVYIRAYHDSNGDGNGDIRGLIEKLDHIKDLGVDCIWVMPHYPSPLKDDGYDISDYYGVHSDYGNLDDFKDLIAAAHARGVKIITDLVLNHTSDQHQWFKESRKSKQSPYRDYYVWSDTDELYQEARIIFLDTVKSNWSWDEGSQQYYWHRFYSSQPDLNYDNPEVEREMINVAKFWLEMGLDGFRADAVPYLYEREGTNCENLPETHAFLKRLRKYMDENYPGTILLSEANQWPEDVRPYFGDGDEVHMNFHFPLMPRMFMALKMGEVTPIKEILARTPAIPENCQWCTFLRNHDELTLEMVTDEERQWMWEKYAPQPRMRLNLGIRRRLAPLLDNNIRKILLANSLLLTLPGSPVIYYGDEIG
ncbi:MAG: alpha-amylase family protein, partial [Anaerolineales bacterium]